MKFEWQNVLEITVGVFFAGAVLLALYGLFGSWLNEQGARIMSKE